MSDLPIDALTLLTTTRSVRRRLDRSAPVDVATVVACLDIALQAPNGANDQAWRFVVVIDPDRRRQIGALYQRANAAFAASLREQAANGDSAAGKAVASSELFWDHLDEVPVLVIAAFEPPPWFDEHSLYATASTYGSIFPAVWSFQLACRLHGLASCLVTSHLHYADEIAEIVDLPTNLRQVGMVAVGRLIGDTFRRVARRPVSEVVHIDSWSNAATAAPRPAAPPLQPGSNT